ncbi:MAG: ABC transporter substrate-binding protein [Betaproteobacteria bacterium]|nr:ABC transporter substrate-binding protein [Betaproteobacteria bacterium]
MTFPTLKFAVISEGVYSWPIYIAQAHRLFEREGVNVEITVTGSSTQQLEKLTRGEYDVGFQQSDHIVRGVERGSDLFIFMAQALAPELTLVAAPAIRSFADLRGKDIAVDGARTGYALLLRKLLADKGLKEGDYTFREIGGSQERFDALKSGPAVASLLNPPFDRNLLAAGFNSLGTTGEYFPTYPGSIAAARRSWAQQNGQALIAYIRAFHAAYAWLKDASNKEAAIPLLPARLNIDRATALRAYDQIAAHPLPSITPDGLRQVINVVWESEGLKGAPGAPEKYLDLSYLEKARQH